MLVRTILGENLQCGKLNYFEKTNSHLRVYEAEELYVKVIALGRALCFHVEEKVLLCYSSDELS